MKGEKNAVGFNCCLLKTLCPLGWAGDLELGLKERVYRGEYLDM